MPEKRNLHAVRWVLAAIVLNLALLVGGIGWMKRMARDHACVPPLLRKPYIPVIKIDLRHRLFPLEDGRATLGRRPFCLPPAPALP